MSKKKQYPVHVTLSGERYRLAIFRVLEVYEDRPPIGAFPIPAECLFIDEDDTVEIREDGIRFFTAYVPESVFGKRPETKKEEGK